MVSLAAVVLAVGNRPEFTGDASIYRSRMELLFAGGVPYVDFHYEHLPLSIVPMALAWILGGFAGEFAYTVIFAGMMLICLWFTARLTDRVGALVGADRGWRTWLLIAAPLFPIVIFRSDPFPTLIAIAALLALALERESTARWLELAGVLAKGWPGVFGFFEWMRNRRARAIVLFAVSSLLLGGLLVLPGFREAREFTGLHSESLAGAATIAFRLIGDLPLDLLYEAGATYVRVPTWVLILNVNVAVLVGLLAFARARSDASIANGSRVLSAGILTLLLLSPTLSPQFLLWPTPFLALHTSRFVRRLALVVMGLTLIYMIGWNPDFEGQVWWVAVLNARNGALVGLGVGCAWTIRPRTRPIAEGALSS